MQIGGGRDAAWAARIAGRKSDRARIAGTPARRGGRRPGWAAALAIEEDRAHVAAHGTGMQRAWNFRGRKECSDRIEFDFIVV